MCIWISCHIPLEPVFSVTPLFSSDWLSTILHPPPLCGRVSSHQCNCEKRRAYRNYSCHQDIPVGWRKKGLFHFSACVNFEVRWQREVRCGAGAVPGLCCAFSKFRCITQPMSYWCFYPNTKDIDFYKKKCMRQFITKVNLSVLTWMNELLQAVTCQSLYSLPQVHLEYTTPPSSICFKREMPKRSDFSVFKVIVPYRASIIKHSLQIFHVCYSHGIVVSPSHNIRSLKAMKCDSLACCQANSIISRCQTTLIISLNDVL